MTRMRKERPTMRIEANASGVAMAATVAAQDEIYENRPTFPGLVSFAINRDPNAPRLAPSYSANLVAEAGQIKAMGNGERDGAWPIPTGVELAPIRCTMPVPCGVCWYCGQAEARDAR